MLEFEAPVTEVWPPEHHTRIFFESPERESSPERYAREVIKRFMTRAFRRPVLNEEVDRFYVFIKYTELSLRLSRRQCARPWRRF